MVYRQVDEKWALVGRCIAHSQRIADFTIADQGEIETNDSSIFEPGSNPTIDSYSATNSVACF
jgi:hypothetical protein